MSNNLTKSELENLLPDYVFGKLSQESIVQFELSIAKYPELLSEIEEIQRVFTNVHSMEYNSSIDNRTRNLSLRVIEKLNLSRSKSPFMNRGIRFASPIIGLIILAMFFFPLDDFKYYFHFISPSNSSQPIEIVRLSDANGIINDGISVAAMIEETIQLSTTTENLPAGIQSIEVLLASAIVQLRNEDSSSLFSNDDDSFLDLSNDELQDTMKDLSYENPTVM